MSINAIKQALQATEEAFLAFVTKQWSIMPQIASVGSCCLVGVICEGTLYIANLGDSRVVLGRISKTSGHVIAVQLSVEHNVSIESVRDELRSRHPDDPQIVVLKHDVWRVKGIIQVFCSSLIANCFTLNFSICFGLAPLSSYIHLDFFTLYPLIWIFLWIYLLILTFYSPSNV